MASRVPLSSSGLTRRYQVRAALNSMNQVLAMAVTRDGLPSGHRCGTVACPRPKRLRTQTNRATNVMVT